MAEKPPNGSCARCAFWRSSNSPLRSTGNRASAARLVTPAASTPASNSPNAAVRCATATWRGSAASSAASRSAGVAGFQRVVVVSHLGPSRRRASSSARHEVAHCGGIAQRLLGPFGAAAGALDDRRLQRRAVDRELRDLLAAALEAALALGQAEFAQLALRALQRFVGLERRWREAEGVVSSSARPQASQRLRRL
jgi:hypothetical protein